ncbi:MFS general substrate transporter [Stipitochalara longipes BDJ]|nr:MFS general substrate transporter [Stipitochalara longipes BDJ]
MARDHTILEEAAPMLGERDEDHPPPSKYWFQVQRPRTIALLLSFLIFLLCVAAALMTVPTTRILEDALCHIHYDVSGTADIDEKLCKDDAIQSQLAYLNGLISMLEAIVGLIVAFPYGVLSDRIGRKPVFFLCLGGTMINVTWTFAILWFWRTIPVQFIVVAPVFLIIGGGYTVVIAVLYSIAADVESDEHRASAFFLMSFAFLSGNMVGTLVASKLMTIFSAWTPLLIAYVMIPLGTSVMIFIPETLQAKPKARKVLSVGEGTLISSLKSQVKEAFTHGARYLSMLKSISLVLVMLTYLIHWPGVLARGQFFVQYFSKRFDWELANTGYLLALRGGISIFMLLVALPGISKLLLSPSFGMTVPKKDLALAQFSLLAITIGSAFVGGNNVPTVISGVIIATLGDGLSPLCRSLATSFVDSRHTSSLYVLIGVVETIGMIYAGPALAWLFTTGMKLKGLWLGLPYFWLATLSALSTLGLCFVRLPEGSGKLEEEEALLSDVEESNLLQGNEM